MYRYKHINVSVVILLVLLLCSLCVIRLMLYVSGPYLTSCLNLGSVLVSCGISVITPTKTTVFKPAVNTSSVTRGGGVNSRESKVIILA